MADGTSQLQQLLAKHGLDTGITEDPREATRRMLADLGIQLPQEEEEGWDIFQPVRTFFGAAGNIGGQLLGLADPQAYEEASKEVLGDLGYDAQSPWYERAEAAPGLGDVAAQMVPDEVRESMVGRAVGPAGRMIGNILGDPTTYTPFVLSRLGGLIARSVPTVAPALKTAALARQARQQKVAAGILDEAAAAADDLADANRIHQLVMSEGTAMKRLGYQTAEGLARGGDLAMGAAAGLAYGPQVVNAAWEGAKRIPEAETLGEGVVEGVNTTLMAGLAALMGKGMIDAATAARTIGAARSGKVLPEVDAQIADGEAQVRAAAEEVEPVVVEPFEPPTPEPITVPEGEPVVLPDGTVIRVPQERPMEAPPEGEPITLPEEGEPVAVPEPVAAPEPGVPLEARDIEPVETALIEPPERRDIMQRRPPPEGLTPEDLELLDLEAARRRLEEEPVLTDEQAAAEVEAAGREPGFVEATPEEVSARMDLAPELQPYAEFVENKDLGAALEARGLTLDEFQSMPHQARMEVLAGKAEPAPVEAPPAEPAPAPEPIEPAPTPEVTEPEVPVKAPPEPSEASDQQAAMVAAEEADEFAAGLDEAPPEPTVERAADTPTEPEPAQAPVPETVPEAVPEDPVGQALTQFDDGLSKHDTGQKAIRSIIEGRKSRGETAPSDPVHAAELQNVLDSREARKDLLGSLKDVPSNRVYPAVKKWLDNRLKKEERGTTTKSTEAAIGKATAEGAAEGLKAKQAKKATKKKAEPGAYEQGKALLEKAGLRYKEFAEGVMADATGALGLPHNQTAFKKYIDLREQGVTRSDAIAQLAKGGIPNLSRNRQTIRNLIKDYEKKLNEDALAKHGERVAKDIELEETPDARPPSAVDVGGLSVDHGRIQQRIPLRPDGMDADGFKSMLQAKKGEMVSMLEDYYRFALRRAEVKGQGAALPDRRLRAFAKNLGIVPKKGENIKRIIRKIGREFGITDDAHFSNLGDVAFVRRAAAQAAAGKFEIPGWKAERGELWRCPTRRRRLLSCAR
jgi:hypothetical protein